MVVYFNGKVGSLCGITGFNGMSTILSLTMKYIDCILESIPLLYHDLMTSWLLFPLKLQSGDVGNHSNLSNLSHTASPLCSLHGRRSSLLFCILSR